MLHFVARRCLLRPTSTSTIPHHDFSAETLVCLPADVNPGIRQHHYYRSGVAVVGIVSIRQVSIATYLWERIE